MSDWFTAHKEGLRQISERQVERRGYGILAAELYQNVMDTDATKCDISIGKLPGKPYAQLIVTDNNPTGFTDLTHAWTVFAPSEKKGDPTKAGRFNLGEKIVLSFCKEASIQTTSGTVTFDGNGRHEYPRQKREVGTRFEATILCTHEQYIEFLFYTPKILVRPGLTLTVNGKIIEQRRPIKVFNEALQTEIGDDLRKSVRQCEVQIFSPLTGEVPMLYELGLPVVETGDKWHVNVMQKVPLNVDRDNVTPAFLRSVRTFVLNNMHDQIKEEDTTSTWVNEAASDERCIAPALQTFRIQKYGEKSVALDPTNPEANSEAAAHGYTVIPARGLTSGQRENLYKNNLLVSSSQQFPTAGKGAYSTGSGNPVKLLDDSELTPDMIRIREYTLGVARRLIGKQINVEFVKVRSFPGKPWDACYGRGHVLGQPLFHYNLAKLGKAWFEDGVTQEVDDLILHELGHEFESNHLSEKYYNALTMLGAKLKAAVMADLKWFKKFAQAAPRPVAKGTPIEACGKCDCIPCQCD